MTLAKEMIPMLLLTLLAGCGGELPRQDASQTSAEKQRQEEKKETAVKCRGEKTVRKALVVGRGGCPRCRDLRRRSATRYWPFLPCAVAAGTPFPRSEERRVGKECRL